MNKLTMPTILVATVMVAGMFAFMPVQQASTVHTTILDVTPTIQVVDNTKNQVSAGATTYTWTSDQPMTVLGFNGVEAAQTDHTTTVITITQVNGVAMNTAAMTYATATTVAAAQTFFSNVDGYVGSIIGVAAIGGGWELPLEGVTSIAVEVVTTAASVTVSNTYSLVATTGGTITPT